VTAVSAPAPATLEDLVDGGRRLEPHAVARLISLFQDRRAAAAQARQAVLQLLDAGGRVKDAVVIGVTGTPGSGKSTLLGRLGAELLRADDRLTLAILAIDPSSPISGGALLGDRARMQTTDDPRLFFRSEAADVELGGLSPSSFQVCRLLSRLFDCVIVETVGIGQSEGDIRHLADHVYLVLAPLGGDELQLMKAGIIEIPDSFVVNKCDEPAAKRTHRQLRSTLWLARPDDGDQLPVFLTSAKTGEGIEPLREAIATQIAAGTVSDRAARDRYFFERWVKDEWGRAGLVHLHGAIGGAAALLGDDGDLDRASAAFNTSFQSAIGEQE
jgi:LAO/AO transport system kinase